jgi:hypothetical protein
MRIGRKTKIALAEARAAETRNTRVPSHVLK